jgi:pseudouridine-5'-phosphate glycosidase/pseudouridine kinase
LTLPDARTAQYVAVNDSKKDLAVAMADMNIISDGQPEPSWVLSNAESAKWAVVDGNWNATEMHKILSTLKTHKQKTKTRFAQTHNFKPRDQKIKTAFEPVSVYKAANLFRKSTYHGTDKVVPLHLVDLATPNVLELTSMWNAAKQNGYFESQEWWERIDALGISGATGARHRFEQITNRKLTDEGIPLQTVQLLPFIPSILTKLGAEGVLLTHLLSPGDYRLRDPNHAKYIVSQNMSGSEVVGGVYMRLFPAVEHVEDVVSVNGVGDTFLGILVAGLTKGVELDETLINIAQRGAVMTLRSKESVSPRLKTLAGELDVLGSYPPHLLEALEREARNAREG